MLVLEDLMSWEQLQEWNNWNSFCLHFVIIVNIGYYDYGYNVFMGMKSTTLGRILAIKVLTLLRFTFY